MTKMHCGTEGTNLKRAPLGTRERYLSALTSGQRAPGGSSEKGRRKHGGEGGGLGAGGQTRLRNSRPRPARPRSNRAPPSAAARARSYRGPAALREGPNTGRLPASERTPKFPPGEPPPPRKVTLPERPARGPARQSPAVTGRGRRGARAASPRRSGRAEAAPGRLVPPARPPLTHARRRREARARPHTAPRIRPASTRARPAPPRPPRRYPRAPRAPHLAPPAAVAAVPQFAPELRRRGCQQSRLLLAAPSGSSLREQGGLRLEGCGASGLRRGGAEGVQSEAARAGRAGESYANETRHVHGRFKRVARGRTWVARFSLRGRDPPGASDGPRFQPSVVPVSRGPSALGPGVRGRGRGGSARPGSSGGLASRGDGWRGPS
ncbi:translation initiation factor IF-2-like [Perognathus longimembris pacificus]|uniref:translation initiation factor IF-2-like n=1 Tax=Perognathus longimembris pacificus TaxID=214514 RepID=UPI0020197680|nr:translation initiation factor IF-2-like [Perognathus longimembris pacificus]